VSLAGGKGVGGMEEV